MKKSINFYKIEMEFVTNWNSIANFGTDWLWEKFCKFKTKFATKF